MQCPRCNTEMRNSTIEAIEINECANCNGIWFDEDELRKAKDQTDADLRWMDFELWKYEDEFRVSPESAKCPKCGVGMAAIIYGETGIEVESCVKCRGLWLDGDEFGKIIEALTDELETKSAQEYVKASLEEAKEIFTGPENLISEWRDFLTVMRMLQYRMLIENPKVNDAILEIQKSLPR